jgi:hypothetical protein
MTLYLAAVPLVSVFSGALLAYCASQLGARTEARQEQARWLRERRFEAYAQFMVTTEKWATRAVVPEPQAGREPEQAFFDEMTAAEAGVELAGPPDAVSAMEPMRAVILDLYMNPGPGRTAGTAYWKLQRVFTAAAQAHMVVDHKR